MRPSVTSPALHLQWLSNCFLAVPSLRFAHYCRRYTIIPSAVSDPVSASSRKTSPTLLTDRSEKPSLDERQYRIVLLENGLEALLVHDDNADKASAAIDINVGSFSDEACQAWLTPRNAETTSTSTNYHFDIVAKPANNEEPTETNPSPLYGALERFAQFFVEPLFLSSTLKREQRAVDSENKKNIQSDSCRLNQLNRSLWNPKNPYCRFRTGNFEVLKTIPESEGINVRDRFIDFHAQHYSANRMKLVILGRESLDVLEKWPVKFFSPIINKSLSQNRWEDAVFRPSDLGIQWFAIHLASHRSSGAREYRNIHQGRGLG